MRFKWVPEPPRSVAALEAVQRAIPLVPAREVDCLRRLVGRETGIDDRDNGRRWLTFLRAIGLVENVSSGYRRRRAEPTADELVDRLLDTVYGGREIYDLLAAADRSLSLDDIDRQASVELPTWERHHHGSDHEQVRRRRLQRLVDWFVLCDAVERTGDKYRLTENSRSRK